MNMRKINNKKVCYFLCLFVFYAFISVYSIMTSKLIYLCSDWYVLKLLICLSIVFYTFCALLTLFVSNKFTKNEEGLKLYILFIFSGLPIGMFLFISQYINKKFLIIYLFVNIFVIFLAFNAKKIKKKFTIDCYFVPSLILIIAFGCINNSLDNTNLTMIIPIEQLAVEYESNIVEKVDRIAYKGTFGKYLEQTIYTNDSDFNSHTYIQLEATNNFFIDLFVNQYYNNSIITIIDKEPLNIVWDSVDTYIVNLKNIDIIYILKTNRKPNEINFNNNLGFYS